MKQDHIKIVSDAAFSLTRRDIRHAIIGCVVVTVFILLSLWLEKPTLLAAAFGALALMTFNLAISHRRLTQLAKGELDEDMKGEIARRMAGL